MDLKKYSRLFVLGISFALIIFAKISLAAPASNMAILLSINGSIGPSMQDYIHRGIDDAIKQKAELIIIKMDTPGGLDKSMRAIVKDIIASPIPIVTYVYPQGSRAASAGTYILYASHIAAMAPATIAGAASPVTKGESTSDDDSANQSTKRLKMINDKVAYIRTLAELRHRNVDWGQQAVLQAATITSQEAIKINVIDIVANDIPDLLQQLNGRTVQVQDHTVVLNTKNIQIQEIKPDWRANFLNIITDPSVAYVLLLLGAYGIFFEFVNPGFVLPGVVGAIALVVALYALQLLPINYAGLALIFLGIIFMALEAFIPSYGALGIGGIVALATGSILLLDTNGPFAIPYLLIFTMTAASIVFFGTLIFLTMRSRSRKVITGDEALLGAIGVARENFHGQGWILLSGERWRAESNVPIVKDQKVRVTKINGLLLTIEPVNKE